SQRVAQYRETQQPHHSLQHVAPQVRYHPVLPISLSAGCGQGFHWRTNAPRRDELFLDPPVGMGQPFFKRDGWLPTKHGAKPCVVTIAAADTLRLCEVMASMERFTCGCRHNCNQL